MRIALLLAFIVLSGCSAQTRICRELTGNSWQKLRTPPENAEQLKLLATIKISEFQSLWYSQQSSGRLLLCASSRHEPECSSETNLFAQQSGQWVNLSKAGMYRVCVD